MSISEDDLSPTSDGRSSVSGRVDTDSSVFPAAKSSQNASFLVGFVRQTSLLIQEEVAELQRDYSVPPAFRWMGIPFVTTFIMPVLAVLVGLASVMQGSVSATLTDIVQGQAIWSSFLGYVSAAVVCDLSALTKWKNPTYAQACSSLFSAIVLAWPIIFCTTGGIFGGLYGLGNTAIVKNVGNGPYFVFCVVGQIVAALLLDATGMLWAKKTPLNWMVYAGAAGALIGALIFQMEGFMSLTDSDTGAGKLIGNLIGAIVVGTMPPFQGAVNRQFGKYMKSARRTSAWSFSTGLLLLGIVCIFVPLDWSQVHIDPSKDWWKFTAGLFAVIGNVSGFIFPRFLGFAAHYCYVMTGQLISSLLFDNFGAFGCEVAKVDAWRICGVIIVLVSVVVVQIGKLHGSKRQRDLSNSQHPFEKGDVSIHGGDDHHEAFLVETTVCPSSNIAISEADVVTTSNSGRTTSTSSPDMDAPF